MSLRYIRQLGISVDQVCNALLGGFADETLSARMYRNARLDEAQSVRTVWTPAERITNWIFLPQDWLVKRRGEWTGARHCERAWRAEIERKQNHPSYRGNDGQK